MENLVSQNGKGKNKVTIENVRKADEGIYECYNDGDREEAKHAIMRLIVRGKKVVRLTMTTASWCRMARSTNILM